jgi:hypothetical protein
VREVLHPRPHTGVLISLGFWSSTFAFVPHQSIRPPRLVIKDCCRGFDRAQILSARVRFEDVLAWVDGQARSLPGENRRVADALAWVHALDVMTAVDLTPWRVTMLRQIQF